MKNGEIYLDQDTNNLIRYAIDVEYKTVQASEGYSAMCLSAKIRKTRYLTETNRVRHASVNSLLTQSGIAIR